MFRSGTQTKPLWGSRFTLAAGAFILALLAVSGRSQARAVTVVGPPVGGVVGMLEDEVHDLPRGRIAWATFWKLCWEAYPGASAYELQTVTGEGTSPKLRRQREQCLRIEAAAGENAQAQGLRDRDLLLALQSGQLAYRVRAVLDDQHVSAWSAPMPVGEATRSESEVPERRAEVLTSLRKNCTLRSILVENPPD